MKKKRRLKWSKKEIAFIETNWYKLTHKEISHEINRTYHSVVNRMQKMVLYTGKYKISPLSIIDLYINEYLSINEIAKNSKYLFGNAISSHAIRGILHNFDIPIRSQANSMELRKLSREDENRICVLTVCDLYINDIDKI